MLSFQTHLQSGPRSARLEQRMTPETKELIEHAARLQGVNASEFILAHGVMAARETLNKLGGTVLTTQDRDAFMRAFDAEPTPELVDLLTRHA